MKEGEAADVMGDRKQRGKKSLKVMSNLHGHTPVHLLSLVRYQLLKFLPIYHKSMISVKLSIQHIY